MVGTLFGHCGAPELIAQFISTQYWPLEERSIELGKERGNKKLGVFPREVENTKQSPKVKEMRCISGERGRRTMVHILPTPRSQQITILTTLSGRLSHFSHKTFHKKLFKFHPPHFSHKNISKLTRPISYKKKTFHIFTANSWSIQKHFDNWKNCYCQHEQIVTTMSEMMCFNKLNETLFQKE